MSIRTALLGTAFAAGFSVWGMGAGAATLTSSFAAWQAGVGGASVTNTVYTGLFDPFAIDLPTTSTVPLNDGQTVQLSNVAQVTEPQNGYPFLLSDGFPGDLLIPQDAAGNQVTSETITPTSGSLSAFGFEVVPFSSNLGGPYSIFVTLEDGQTLSVSAPGGDFNTGTTTPFFFGYYGGPVASLTITTNDPNGFAFGNFVDVPEPASMALLTAGLLGMACFSRRRV